MSNFEESSSNPIALGDEKPLGYYLNVSFHPGISLEKKLGYEFATTLAEYLEIDASSFESTAWHLSSKRDGVAIALEQSQLTIAGENPAGGKSQEWYEHRYQEVLTRFAQKFEPQIVLGSKAMVRFLLDVDGDARDFLAQRLMNVTPKRFGPLQRPIQLLGMRISFPPFMREWKDGPELKNETTDWSLELKVESWAADPRKLFVEADASWQEPMQWDGETVEKLVGRLDQLTSYLGNVRTFLDMPEEDYGDPNADD